MVSLLARSSRRTIHRKRPISLSTWRNRMNFAHADLKDGSSGSMVIKYLIAVPLSEIGGRFFEFPDWKSSQVFITPSAMAIF
jgi:hypothetical protein